MVRIQNEKNLLVRTENVIHPMQPTPPHPHLVHAYHAYNDDNICILLTPFFLL